MAKPLASSEARGKTALGNILKETAEDVRCPASDSAVHRAHRLHNHIIQKSMTQISEISETYTTISCSIDQRGIARVQLMREEVFNAFDETMISEITACFTVLSNEPSARIIVLSAVGKVFSAGADLGWMKRASANNFEENHKDAIRFAEMMQAMHQCVKPIVARVQGPAFGGGVGLLCVCDIVISAQAAKFAVTEARFGILPAVIGPYLIEAVGVRTARRLALSAERISADEAKQLGLIHASVRDEELDAKVEETLQALLNNGPAALIAIKSLFARIAARPIDSEVTKITAETIAKVRSTVEAREGFTAFLEKRNPAWNVK